MYSEKPLTQKQKAMCLQLINMCRNFDICSKQYSVKELKSVFPGLPACVIDLEHNASKLKNKLEQILKP